MAFSEQLWDHLLNWIEDRQIIPVIGPELLVLDLPGERIVLSRYLARELAAHLNVPEQELPAAYDIDDLVCQFLRRPGSDAEDLYDGVRDLMARTSWPTPEPLKKLAAIVHLDLYVSTTFDSLLEQALNEVRFGGAPRTRSLAYSRLRTPEDLPAEYVDAGSNAPAEPAVYHLFGRFSRLRDYALREEDLLQFCHRLQSRDQRPPNLFDLFRNRNNKILALGCGFPGWLTRFFLAGAKGDQLFTEGARGVIADDSSHRDLRLVYFLERRRTTVFDEGGGVAFVDELHRRWMERFGQQRTAAPAEVTAPNLPDFKPDSVFISYASEDRTEARRIKESLERAGVDVWFDEIQLEPGDVFQEKILRSIERCSVFLPVISRHVATAARRRFLFLEWNRAVEESKAHAPDDPFIQPVVIDDTAIDSPHIPDVFAKRHWQKARDGSLPDDFSMRIRQHLRDLRRESTPV